MRKALFVSESQGWSGGAAQLLVLGQGLAKRGWDVRLASPEDGDVAGRWVKSGLTHIPFRPRQDYDLINALRLAKMVDKEKIDVLHAHHPRAHAVCLASRYLSRRSPVFLVTRRVSFARAKNIFSRLKYLNPRIDAFIAVAENVRGQLIQGGVKAGKVHTIPSGVDTEVYVPTASDDVLRAELGITNGHKVLSKIGNYGEWKGQDIFLRAAKRLLDAGRPIVCLLAGRDTDGDIARERVEAAGLPSDAVRLLGFRQDVPRLLSITDISINAATRGEGISGAIRESLAMEIPVAASNAGGNGELVREGETGRLFTAGSDEDLARVLGEILDDPVAAKKTATTGAQLVRKSFSVDFSVARTLELYEKLLGAKA
jgi:glycosyltransferase involved in cell wall biosynthesis